MISFLHHIGSSKEYRSFDFRPDISVGHQFDPFIVPNVPLLTAAWELARAGFLREVAVKTFILATQSKPFVVSIAIEIFIILFDPTSNNMSMCFYFLLLVSACISALIFMGLR